MPGAVGAPVAGKVVLFRVQKPVPKTLGSVTLTHGFRVSVSPRFMLEHSDHSESRFVFSYKIRIANQSAAKAKLIARRWVIVDGNDNKHTVEGEGVVGQQPELGPGQVHEYSSFCPLPTPWGTMEGAYIMQKPDGATFEIEIGRFYLIAPEE